MRRHLLLTVAMAAALPALAFSTATAQESEDDGDVIIVTAQKRDQDIRDVPFAITAFDQDGLDQLGIQQFDDLANFVPGIEVQEQSANNPGFVIRGITSDSGDATIEPRVAIFQNNVPISRSRGSFVELFDSQVEVVRGPQPTLFGRSALIGAFNITTVRPELGTDNMFSGFARVGGGNEDFLFAEGAVNASFGDTFAVRVAGRYKERDGYIENLIGEDLNGFGTTALRASARWMPTDRFEANLIGEYQNDDNPGTSFKSGTFLPVDSAGTPGSIDPSEAAALSSFGGLEGGRELGLERDLYSLTLLLDWQINDMFTVSSVTNYREFDSSEVFDPDGFGLPLFAFAENAESEQFFQEVRLGFDNASRLTGFIGASIFQEEGSQNVPLYYDERVAQALLGGFLFSGTPGTTQTPPPLAALPTVNADPSSPLFGAPLGIFAEQFTNFGETTSYDVFADATFAVTDRLDVTAGIRYTFDDKESGYSAGLVGGAPVAPAVVRPTEPGDLSALTGAGIFLGANVFNNNTPIFAEEEYDGISYRVAVNYDLTDELTAFANYGRGRRPEVLGYSANIGQVGLQEENFTEIDAEETDAFDVGLRGNLFNDGLTAEVVAYYYEYTNFQTSIQTEQGIIPANGGNASGPGFETSLRFNNTPFGALFGNYAYNGVEFDDRDEDGNPQLRAGNRFRLAPEHAFSVGTVAQFECNCGTFTFVPTYTYRTEIFFDDDNDTTDFFQDEVENGYGLLNARLTFVPSADESWMIEAFVENALDEEYLLDAGNTGDAFGIPTFIAGVPQMYGVYVRKSF